MLSEIKITIMFNLYYTNSHLLYSYVQIYFLFLHFYINYILQNYVLENRDESYIIRTASSHFKVTKDYSFECIQKNQS